MAEVMSNYLADSHRLFDNDDDDEDDNNHDADGDGDDRIETMQSSWSCTTIVQTTSRDFPSGSCESFLLSTTISASPPTPPV